MVLQREMGNLKRESTIAYGKHGVVQGQVFRMERRGNPPKRGGKTIRGKTEKKGVVHPKKLDGGDAMEETSKKPWGY